MKTLGDLVKYQMIDQSKLFLCVHGQLWKSAFMLHEIQVQEEQKQEVEALLKFTKMPMRPVSLINDL